MRELNTDAMEFITGSTDSPPPRRYGVVDCPGGYLSKNLNDASNAVGQTAEPVVELDKVFWDEISERSDDSLVAGIANAVQC